MGWLLKLGMFPPFLPERLLLMIDWFSILCGDHAIKQIDKPFISPGDKVDDWTL